MNVSQAQIDQIVRDVLSALGSVRESATAPAVASPASSPCDELRLTDRVVTLETLAGKLGGVRKLVVGKKAIITPAANDELREQKIQCVRCDATAGKTQTSQSPGTLLLASINQQQVEAAAKAIDSKVEAIVAKTLVDAVSQLCGRIAVDKSCGVVLTEQTATAVCLANRHRHIRAAHVADYAAARDATTSVGANVLIVDARGMSGFVLNRIVQTICGGAKLCPAELQRVLEATN